jgi:hypothetical protein
MKKLFFVVVLLLMTCLISTAQDTLVYWNFTTAPYDTLADGGNAFNTMDLISRDTSWHGSFAYTAGPLGLPDRAISSTNWTLGNGVKYYQVGFSTSAHQNITFSSKQRSSPTGPKYFKVQYKVNSGGSWTDIPGAIDTCEDNFTKAVLTGISLPPDCNNQPDLYLRWIMTSDSGSSNGGLVQNAGTSRLDDLYIFGDLITGIDAKSTSVANYSIYPQPCDGTFTFEQTSEDPLKADIIDVTGKMIYSQNICGRNTKIAVPGMFSGLYFIRIIDQKTNVITVRKLVINR